MEPSTSASLPQASIKRIKQEIIQVEDAVDTEETQLPPQLIETVTRTDIKCVPGDRLIKADELTLPYTGTYKIEGYIHASLAGRVMIRTRSNGLKLIEVVGNNRVNKTVPSLDDIVTCQVTGIQRNLVNCIIWCINDQVLRQPFKAVVRREDIRHNEKDVIDISKSCLPGDILLGKILGFENRRYLVSIADKEFGVVIATSEADATMIPVSWTQMMCPKTGIKEDRKVAKIKMKTED